jgi:hypothetical protein
MLTDTTPTINTQGDVDGYVNHVIATARTEAAARGYVGKDASDYALGWVAEDLAIVIRLLLTEKVRLSTLMDDVAALHRPIGFDACSCGTHDCLTSCMTHREME